jgi:hypothetical protein
VRLFLAGTLRHRDRLHRSALTAALKEQLVERFVLIIELATGCNGLMDEGRAFNPANPPFLRSPKMKKFLVTYLAPASVIDDWKKTEPKQRKEAEEKMQEDWKKWMGDHMKMFADKGAGVGKTKRVTSKGTADARNDIMLYAIVDAESHEAAAKTFEGHPHLQIPQASIEVMEINPLPGV